MQRVHIETWGCQMNTADSERMLELLKARDYEMVGSPEEADLILLNTCHIREKARHKVMSRLGVLKELKQKTPGLTIAVAGCVAQAEGARMIQDAPTIDVLFGPGRIDDLPQLLDQFALTKKPAVALGFKSSSREGHTLLSARTFGDEGLAARVAPPTVSGKHEVSRYVNIQQGCDNFCTFCVVPLTRGREISKAPQQVVQECELMVGAGAREITLLGQNVNSYGLDIGTDMVALLKQVAQIDGLERIRFTTSNPHDFTESLAELFLIEPKLGRYLHLPVQSGSDRILTAMKRKVTASEYRQKISWLRQRIPDVALSTDLIVGFPGETDQDFQETLELVEEIGFSFCFAFKYSPRKNTPAARYQNQVPEDVKESRLKKLNLQQDHITRAQQLAQIGRLRRVLFHYESQKNPGFYYGRTEHFRLVRVESSKNLIGQMSDVFITDGNKTALIGNLV